MSERALRHVALTTLYGGLACVDTAIAVWLLMGGNSLGWLWVLIACIHVATIATRARILYWETRRELSRWV